ncbi:MAG: RsmE family RNA methyltransferase [Elusimicrobiales bacterium]|jgi:16S rRNA (uracil1498-N3)-methyltransferase
MPQYFVTPDRIRDGSFSAGEDESRHITRAARKRAGDEIEIFDGAGNRYLAVIGDAGEIVSGRIKKKLVSSVYKTRLVLCFAPVSRTAAEAIIEHCTEAGAAAFQPALTSRTQFDWFGSWPEKARRFEQLSLAACKQCGRASLPELLKPQKFDDLLCEAGPAVIASGETGENFETAAAGLHAATEIKVFIGPEGGFTRGELEYAAEKGVKQFSLGKHTLRAETAALAASVVVLDRLG